MLMYTSCGWFFDDISGIETVQIIAYAARVLQLAAYLFSAEAPGLESKFITRLAEAKSNDAKAGDGARSEFYLIDAEGAENAVKPKAAGKKAAAKKTAVKAAKTAQKSAPAAKKKAAAPAAPRKRAAKAATNAPESRNPIV